MNKTFCIKSLLAGAFLMGALGQTAVAAEVAGIKFANTTTVAGKELQLNGLGVRYKSIVKVYATALYLPEKKSTTEDVIKSEGPRRLRLVMLRDVTSEDLGSAFMAGLDGNLDSKEKTQLATQISQGGEMFGLFSMIKKGDVLDVDWIPGSGITCFLNGKRFGGVAPGIAFHNAILKIWLGNKPVDGALKAKLLNAPV